MNVKHICTRALLAKSQPIAPGCYGCCALLLVCSGSALEVELTWKSKI